MILLKKGWIRKISITFLLGFVVLPGMSQDVQFSQYYSNLIYLNPAFAGYYKCPRLSLNYRNQWMGLGTTFVSYYAAIDQYVKLLHGGVGLQIMNDTQSGGTMNLLTVDGIYSYTIKVKQDFIIQTAIQAGYLQWNINARNLIFSDMIDPSQGIVNGTGESLDFSPVRTMDISSGVVGFTPKYYFGVSVHHIRQPFLSEPVQPIKFTLHFGANIRLDSRDLKQDKLTISPNIIVQQQQNFQQINYGVYFTKKIFTFGGWIRQSFIPYPGFDSFILLMGVSLKKIRVGYSYDVTLSKLRRVSFGTHEVSLNYQFDCYEKIKKPSTISCPSF